MRTTSSPIALSAMIVIVTIAAWLAAETFGPIGSGGRDGAAPTTGSVFVEVAATATLEAATCRGAFSQHELPHVTRPTHSPARLFDSNGSGVAADDLDGDGLADIVLGNLEGPNTILWNEGDWVFTAEQMRDRATRTVNLVDVDADGRLDIVTTHRGSGVAAYRNLGDRHFETMPLSGVTAPGYSMAWGDMDGDGDVDLATGSYDAELDQQLRSTFLFGDGAGVYVYTHDGARSFTAQRLADASHALATALLDLDLDGTLDLVVGNDFAMRDMVWLGRAGGDFVPATPFQITSEHTMSLDAGDIDGDGVEEIFATDMRPATSDTDALAQWLPLMATMSESDEATEPQRIRNVLQVSNGDGTFREVGRAAGVDASGWAWSGRFGDLDNDGDSDLYVVNGMIAAETFSYLPNGELRERNVAYSNRGDGTFEVADWHVDPMASGRGSVLVDLDNDGRLDIVVNNLESPALALQNELCDGGAIELALRQPDTGNTHAVGAQVTIHTQSGIQVRNVRSGGGYLSGSPTTLHFGMGRGDSVELVEIRWPDGTSSAIDQLDVGFRYEVGRT